MAAHAEIQIQWGCLQLLPEPVAGGNRIYMRAILFVPACMSGAILA
jgi:hypothetical protein